MTTTLEDIAIKLDAVLLRISKLEARLAAGPAASGAAKSELAPAPASDLDGQHGNPQVKFTPKRWKGDPMVGEHFDVCPPDFLRKYAEALEWSATHPRPGKEQYAHYDLKDASRALGWALRIEARQQKPIPDGQAPLADDEDDLGF